LLLVDGVVATVASVLRRGEGRGMLALLGVLSAIAGLVLMKKPFDTLGRRSPVDSRSLAGRCVSPCVGGRPQADVGARLGRVGGGASIECGL